jgi:hypothetical protein
MDIALKEVGATLLIGLFTVLTADAFVVYLLGRKFIGFFDNKIGFSDRAKQKATLLVAVSFVVGMLAEDLSYKFVDDEANPVVATANIVTTWIEHVQEVVWPNEPGGTAQRPASTPHRAISRQDFRFHTLVQHQVSSEGKTHFVKPTKLGREIGALGLFQSARVTLGRVSASTFDSWLAAERPEMVDDDCVKAMGEASERLYYVAKNTTFLEDNLFQELTRIETRLDFSRSISLISFVFLVAAQALLVGRLFELFASPSSRTRMKLPPILIYAISIGTFALVVWKVGMAHRAVLSLTLVVGVVLTAALLRASHARQSALCQACALLLTLFGFYLAGVTAYWREQEEFDKRAFGYYVTLHSKTLKPTEPIFVAALEETVCPMKDVPRVTAAN